MTYCVYGIRLRGDKEVRYIGQTNRTPEARIANHRGDRCNRPLQTWLLSNDVEGFEIARCDTREEALATEKVIIALCVRLNHRLLNRDGVPKHLRAPKLVAA